MLNNLNPFSMPNTMNNNNMNMLINNNDMGQYMNSMYNNQISFNNMSSNPNFGNFVLNNALIQKNIQNNNTGDAKLNNLTNLDSINIIKRCKNKYDDKVYDEITRICNIGLIAQNEIKDIAGYCACKIKEKFRGQWFVMIQDLSSPNNNFEFRFTQFKEDDMIIFQCSDKIFYVASF